MSTLIIVLLTIILMILSLIFLPKIRIGKYNIDTYYIITTIGALIIIFTGQIKINELKTIFFNDNGMNPVKIIILFLSMAFMSIFLDKVGFFKYLAGVAANKFQKNQISLFLALFFLISILTVFTSNDIIILTFTPFICYFCKHTKINPIPYLIGEFFAANTLSMILIIGNPTNIYIASNAHITFIEYFSKMVLVGLLASILLCLILIILFRKSLKKPLEPNLEIVHIESKFLLFTGILHLSLCMIVMAISNYVDIEMYLVSLGFMISLFSIALIYCLVKKQEVTILGNSLKALPYAFIPFLSSMVILISALNKTPAIKELALILSKTDSPILYGISSFILGNVLNNIPMSILYSEILSSSIVSSSSIYAVIASSNLCALLSPLGSLAGMMFLDLVKKQNVNLNFIKFMKYGFIGIILAAFSFSLIILG